MALKWHPDKHNNSQEAVKRFQKISIAYRHLTQDGYDSEDDFELSLDDMFELFQQVFFPTSEGFSNGYDSSDFEEDEHDDDDESEEDAYDTITPVLTAEV